MSEFWHEPAGERKGALALTHGAGSNANAPVLVAVAEAFARAGFGVLRFDLAFRLARPRGSPFPAGAAQDRAGILDAARRVRDRFPGGRLIVGGHSYGGRQSSMLAAETPDFAGRLLLLSYPLHPPNKPEQLRVAHLPNLRIPALFVHGSRDPFGTVEEIRAAMALIPSRADLFEVARAGHDLKPFQWTNEVAALF